MADADDTPTRAARRTPAVPGSTAAMGPAREASGGAEVALATASADGRYRLTGELARGGMGRVSRGMDDELGREVAVKESLDRDPEVIARLLREAAITARLQHPSIVSLYDVARDDGGAPLLVMRLVEGRPLDEVIAAAGTLDERLALLPKVIPAVEAVAYAHRRGVVHRDLKPSNILVGEMGDTVVIDWGLATFGVDSDFARSASVAIAEGLTQTGAVFGTPGFMAPEQARGETADHRADVFALGATLFFTLTGRRPFEGDSATRLIEEAGSRAATPLVEAEPGIPRDLATIVDKALAHAAADRYPTAELMAGDLRDFLAGRLVSAHHYPRRQRLRRFAARHRVPLIAISLALAAVAAIAVIAVGRVVAARDRARAALGEATAAEHRATVARERETARADDLVETQAEIALAGDPTRAVALLALRSRRGDAIERAITADAVGRGLVSSWPAHDGLITGVAWLGDGAALTVGWDRRVVWHDLHGGRRELRHFDDGPVEGPVRLDDGTAVVAAPDRLVRFDATGAVAGEWPLAREPLAFAAAGTWIFWADPGGVHARDVISGQVRDAPGTALGGFAPATATWIYADHDRVRAMALGTGAIREVATGALADVATDGRHALLRVGAELIEVDTADPTAPRPRWPVADDELAMYGLGRPVAMSGDALRLLGGDTLRLPTRGRGMMAAGADAIAIAQDDDVALVFADHVRWLRGNPAPVARFAFDPRGRAILCATLDGRLARWDLTAAAPVRTDLGVEDVNQLAAVGPDRYAAIGAGGGIAVVAPDGVHHHGDALHLLSFDRFVAAEGGRALVVAGPDGVVLGVRDAAPFVIARGVAVVASFDDTAIATITPDGHLARVAIAPGGAVTPLGELGAATRGLYQRDGVVLALGEDRRLWRRTARGTIDQAIAPRPVTGAAYLRADGSALIGVDGGLVDWPAGGAPVLRREVAGRPIDVLDDGVVLATTDDGAVWVERGDALVPLLAGDVNRGTPALAAQRVIFVEDGGRVRAIEPRSGATTDLPIAVGFVASVIALDRGRTVVVAGGGRVVEWHDPAPEEPAAFLAWRAGLTNASLAEPRAALSWR